ncbi:hypothetical protein NUW54_g10244 [Trametes sanguinea]|uniref:Uncharacterized protein n=1 Tax=Trametes sanguinea TaxID=158606 RepID=A0ACC1P0E9_9APHY|nr:hypothetical protein NUW54_g10244 [Trametes sanguinea]
MPARNDSKSSRSHRRTHHAQSSSSRMLHTRSQALDIARSASSPLIYARGLEKRTSSKEWNDRFRYAATASGEVTGDLVRSSDTAFVRWTGGIVAAASAQCSPDAFTAMTMLESAGQRSAKYRRPWRVALGSAGSV